MSDLEVIIVQAQKGDAERMIHLHFDAVHQGANNFYAQALLDSWSPMPSPSRYEWMRDTLLSRLHLVLVAENKREICGFVICSLSDGFIQALYVDPQFSGRGIGKSLLSSAEGYLIRTGISVAKLKSSNNSVNFYKSAGYRVMGPTTQKLNDGTEMNCYEMQRTLATTA